MNKKALTTLAIVATFGLAACSFNDIPETEATCSFDQETMTAQIKNTKTGEVLVDAKNLKYTSKMNTLHAKLSPDDTKFYSNGVQELTVRPEQKTCYFLNQANGVNNYNTYKMK